VVLENYTDVDDKVLILEGYGLQPVHKVNQSSGALAPAGTSFTLSAVNCVVLENRASLNFSSGAVLEPACQSAGAQAD
jgi:hypothetical protein